MKKVIQSAKRRCLFFQSPILTVDVITLPTLLLREILRNAMIPLFFCNYHFQSAFTGRVLAESGHGTDINFSKCEFEPPAEQAFVDAMLSKMDPNSGLTGICFEVTMPFGSDHWLPRLLMSGNGPIAFSYLFPESPYSEEMLDCLRNIPRLQSLELCAENFTSKVAYASFVRSLNSTSLRRLTISGWNFYRDVPFPVEIFQNLSLTHFSFKDVTFSEVGWRNLLQEIPKCKTINSLGFEFISWWGSIFEELARVEFALELAHFLKHNQNIISTNTKTYFNDERDYAHADDILYTTYLAPVLEHNRLLQNLKMLKERENYEVRGFLVSEAVGTRFAGKVSHCYTMIKGNMDVLVSFLSSHNEAQEV